MVVELSRAEQSKVVEVEYIQQLQLSDAEKVMMIQKTSSFSISHVTKILVTIILTFIMIVRVISMPISIKAVALCEWILPNYINSFENYNFIGVKWVPKIGR